MKVNNDFFTISEIVKRAKVLGVGREQLFLAIDIDTAHEICRLDLDGLLVADDDNFMHDVCGIVNHLNRETKTFDNGFNPRFARGV